MTIEHKTIGLISHGCAKNLVDSELMLGMLIEAGYKVTLDDTEADIIIVNTCSFIHDAEKESVQSVLEMVTAGKKVIIAGCLPQKHREELVEAVPEAVAHIGTADIDKIVSIVESIESEEFKLVYQVSDTPYSVYPEKVQRQQITVGASSYIKIAEGCNYKCGYCIIPELRGPYRSRDVQDIVREAKQLAQKGVNEIVLVAQDTSYYGFDRYGAPILASLLQHLNDIEEVQWIRVMYMYPSMINDELIEAIATLDKVVKYVDIPLQHSHPEVLKSMCRPAFDYKELVSKLRDRIPNVAIRTAFIVGYPGETQEQFDHLYNFVKECRFDKLGVFEYSKEKNTISHDMPNHVAPEVMAERKDKIMLLQQKISKEVNAALIGTELPAIVESMTEDGQIIARTYRDAPEIDGYIYIDTEKALLPGDIEMVKVVDADEYDLFGEV